MAEPNKNIMTNEQGWYTDTRKDAAVKVCKVDAVKIRKWGYGDGFVWIETGEYAVYSCYISPNTTTEEYTEYLVALKKNRNDKEWPKNHCSRRLQRKVTDVGMSWRRSTG